MSLYNAIQMAPYVSTIVPFIIAFFFVLGLMAQDKPRRKPVITTDYTPANPKVISNEDIIKGMK